MRSGMIDGLEWQTCRSGHRAKLEPDRVEAISYSTRNCGATVAGHNSCYVSSPSESEPKAQWARSVATLSLGSYMPATSHALM